MSYKEVIVGKTTDLAAGEMKQVSANGVDILLACAGGNFHAVGAHCTHYGASLVEGVLNGERIVCPWHHACFNVTTGNLHEPPALDALPTYELKIQDEQIIVRVPDDAPDRRTPGMSKRDQKDERVFVIAGGGAAGYVAAQTLREDRFTGRIVLITRENNLPYDRPNLSKDYLQGTAQPEWLPLRSEEFFAEHDIELIRGREIARIDAADKKIVFADGTVLHGDALLLATGGEPRTLPFQSDAQKKPTTLNLLLRRGPQPKPVPTNTCSHRSLRRNEKQKNTSWSIGSGHHAPENFGCRWDLFSWGYLAIAAVGDCTRADVRRSGYAAPRDHFKKRWDEAYLPAGGRFK